MDLPDLPPWVDTVRKFAIPILIAFFIARGEVKRRRKAEEKKALDLEFLETDNRGYRLQVVRPSRSCSPSGQTARITPAAASALRQPGQGGSVM